MKRRPYKYVKDQTHSPDSLSPLLDPNQAAEFLGVTPGTLAVWRVTRKVEIPYVKIGSAVRYTKPALLEHVRNNTCKSSSDSESEGGCE